MSKYIHIYIYIICISFRFIYIVFVSKCVWLIWKWDASSTWIAFFWIYEVQCGFNLITNIWHPIHDQASKIGNTLMVFRRTQNIHKVHGILLQICFPCQKSSQAWPPRYSCVDEIVSDLIARTAVALVIEQRRHDMGVARRTSCSLHSAVSAPGSMGQTLQVGWGLISSCCGIIIIHYNHNHFKLF